MFFSEMILLRHFFPCNSAAISRLCFKTNVSGHLLTRSLSRRVKNENTSIKDDPDYADLHDEDFYPEPTETVLEDMYDNYERKIRKNKKSIQFISGYKKFFNRPKDPSMLTASERQHIKFLHETNPEEWTVERLSEAFPALPYVISRILKNNWQPSNLERLKERDKIVYENWEKLKRNELEASPEAIEHFKKFIDRRENLKSQMENPNFFYLPEKKKTLKWHNGEMNSLLENYENQIKLLLQLERSDPKLLPQRNGNTSMDSNEGKAIDEVEAEIQTEKEIQNVDDSQDSFFMGRPGGRGYGKQMTLEELKTEMLENSEIGKLSSYEKSLLNRSLMRSSRRSMIENGGVQRKGKEVQGTKCESDSEELRQRVEDLVLRDTTDTAADAKVQAAEAEKLQCVETSRGRTGRRIRKRKELEDLPVDNIGIPPCGDTKLLSEFQLSELLAKKNENKPTADPKNVEFKNTKPSSPVNYYGTEKDKIHCAEEENLLSQTPFWNSGRSTRKQSKDTGLSAASPHLAQQLDVFFSYDYPQKIEIPEKERKKGRLYRVKDCYYDDDGVFLYRVPGMVNS